MTTSWASARTGISVRVEAAVPDLPAEVLDSIGLGLRRNPKRAQLLVSAVLGKHVPVRASVCLHAGQLLADAVTAPGPYDVVGFAETATGLGHQVAHGLQAQMYVHTTRRPGDHPRVRFLEEHSHATEQVLTAPPGGFDPTRVAVLVDDEISTGRTALNALEALDTGHTTWVLASLLDTRSAQDRQWCADRARDLGITLLDATLLRGSVLLEADSSARASAVVATVVPPTPRVAAPHEARIVQLGTAGLRTTARHGFTPEDDVALRSLAEQVAPHLPGIDLVLGDEELMYFPQLLAMELGDALTSTTTRSPAVAIDEDGYPLRSAVTFDAIGEPGRAAFAYNTAGAGRILLVTEDPFDDRGTLAALRPDTVLVLNPELPAGTIR